MTDPPSDQPPLSEDYLHAALERAEDATPEPCEVIYLARECLRLRGLLAEAAGALGLLGVGIVSHRKHWPTEVPFVEGCPGCEHNKQLDAAAAVAARVRAHLNPTETHPDADA